MDTFLITVSKYLFIFLSVFYVWEGFAAIRCHNPYKISGIFQRQNGLIFSTYIVGIVTIYLNQTDKKPVEVIILGGLQLSFLIVVLGIFPVIYPKINRALLSNMAMLLTIGFIVLARLPKADDFKQFIIVVVATMASLIVPFFMSKFEIWKSYTWIYFFVGLALLIIVILAPSTKGAKIQTSIMGVTVQPTEFVKIIFVFFVAGMLQKSSEFKNVVLTCILSGIYVLVLVAGKDLGAALIFYMTFMFMIYVGTRKIIYLIGGTAALSVASLLAFKLFSHVQTRVNAWIDPWQSINDGGYQVAQSLFAIGSGGVTGTGLYHGFPEYVPEIQQDFIFSAIAEEFGAIFAIALILICLICFIAFLIIAMEQVSTFNKLVCVGLGVSYATQVILTIGGALKMIPSTGVTLPLVSYGGSSILATLIVFAIIQGLAIVGTDSRKTVMRTQPSKPQIKENVNETKYRTTQIPRLEETTKIPAVRNQKKKKIK